MQQGATGTRRTIALLSPSYFRSEYTTAEWTAALCQDPTNRQRALIPFRVADCRPEGLLGPLVYTDLFDRGEPEARQALLAAVERVEKGRAKPARKPAFPAHVEGQPLRLPSVLPEPFNVPARNPNFTGRRELLEQLRQALTSAGTAALSAVHGLGGVGKTQLAIEYAWRYHTSYQRMWWIRAEEPATCTTDFAALAEALGLVERGFADQQAAASAAIDWLRRNDGWLLVFDNAPGPAQLGGHLPSSAAGHAIVTSRNPAWRGQAAPLEVNVLGRQEAVEFLLKRSGQTEAAAAAALCDDLGDLPLAVEQAAAYLEQTGITLAGYLARFRDYSPELLDLSATASYPHSVAKTWGLSIDRLEGESPASLELLDLIAFYAPDDIPRDLWAPHFKNALQADQAIAGLRRYSLVSTAADSLSVHRLVQQVTRGRLVKSGQEAQWAETAAGLADDAFRYQKDQLDTWPASTRQSPHVLAAAGHGERLGVALESVARVLNESGLYLLDRGRLEEAESALKRALAIAEKFFGPDDLKVATCANNIGSILKNKGDLAGALKFTKRALAIAEKVFGPDDPKVATCANNIGQILKDKGDLEGALQYTQRALAIDEKVFGPDHPEVAIRANNIGQILQDQGDLEGALQYTKRALEIDEKVLGPDHPKVAIRANNIGGILKDQGDLKGAFTYTQRALRILEATYGPGNPLTETARRNLEVIRKALK